MAKMHTFEIFINTHPSRVAVIDAANLYAAHDRAVALFPGVDFRRFIIVPTTIDRALGAALERGR